MVDEFSFLQASIVHVLLLTSLIDQRYHFHVRYWVAF